MQAAHSFGQGFSTVEYTASALLDARLHQVKDGLETIDLAAWEAEQLASLGMPRAMVMRHRLPHFQHMFSSDSYASAYYVYLWAEVLDAGKRMLSSSASVWSHSLRAWALLIKWHRPHTQLLVRLISQPFPPSPPLPHLPRPPLTACTADAFDAFKETGDCFNPTVAQKALQFIYSAGNSADPAELFRQFRGRDPVIEAMLKKKGLLQ